MKATETLWALGRPDQLTNRSPNGSANAFANFAPSDALWNTIYPNIIHILLVDFDNIEENVSHWHINNIVTLQQTLQPRLSISSGHGLEPMTPVELEKEVINLLFVCHR